VLLSYKLNANYHCSSDFLLKTISWRFDDNLWFPFKLTSISLSLLETPSPFAYVFYSDLCNTLLKKQSVVQLDKVSQQGPIIPILSYYYFILFALRMQVVYICMFWAHFLQGDFISLRRAFLQYVPQCNT